MIDGEWKLNLRLDHIKALLPGATDEALAAIAAQIEGQAKANIASNGQVDTGFMMNSVGHNSKHAGAAPGAMSGPSGQVAASMPPLMGDASALVHVAADYTIYQEGAQSFLYRAGEQVAGTTVQGTVERVFSKLK